MTPMLGIMSSAGYPRTITVDYLVVAGGGGGGVSAGGGGGAGALPSDETAHLRAHSKETHISISQSTN